MQTRRPCRSTLLLCAALALLLASGGCMFSEHAFPVQRGDVVPLRPMVPVGSPGPERLTTRQWLDYAQRELTPLLPVSSHPALLTEDMALPGGGAVDVMAHFDLDPLRLGSPFYNFRGLTCTAQVVGSDEPDRELPLWPGFQDVWIPINDQLRLSGRLGLARDRFGRILDADCVVILPGLRGNNNILRTRDLAEALRANGIHALALEMRGHGRTEKSYPQFPDTWGIQETDDLLVVSDWLVSQPHIRHTGLIGYCWGGNQALLAGWADGRLPGDPSITDRVRPLMRDLPARRRFQAGIIALSPPLAFEQIIDQAQTPRAMLSRPVINGLQKTVRRRMEELGSPDRSGSLLNLVKLSCHGNPDDLAAGLRFLRFLPYLDRPASNKLEDMRMPVMILQCANDPLASAQAVANAVAWTSNPNVSAVIIPGGGHDGFAPYARRWYYSMVMDFFDPTNGPAALQRLAAAGSGDSPARLPAPSVTSAGPAPYPTLSTER
ncbi:MAG: hypothetical protein BIFFINMI_01045 [Phycisphaerae bacterium]|nr:hypothetical protein [Phycisphaerae bacterium]